MMEPSLRVRRRQKWNWSEAELDEVNIGRKKLEATPILASPNFVSIIPVFQKHNISIKVLINNDITNNLISNSRYYTKKTLQIEGFLIEKIKN